MVAIGEVLRSTTPTPRPSITEPICESELILLNDRYMKKPEISVPFIGSLASLNPDANGIRFKPSTSSTPISLILKFKSNIIIEQLVQLEIPRPSNVNRFQVNFLDRYRRVIGRYGIVSTKSDNLFVSPLINRFPLTKEQTKKIRAVKIVLLDTDDDRSPDRVTIRMIGCVKKKKIVPKSTSTLILMFKSNFSHLFQKFVRKSMR